jgi:hypothetical protein
MNMFHTIKIKYIFTDMFHTACIISNFFTVLPLTRKIRTGLFGVFQYQKYFTCIRQSEYSRELLYATKLNSEFQISSLKPDKTF